jgi:hypothetical protein
MTAGTALFVITAVLLAIMLGIIGMTLRKNRRQRLESPKYRMLEDD